MLLVLKLDVSEEEKLKGRLVQIGKHGDVSLASYKAESAYVRIYIQAPHMFTVEKR
jgi:hypothetical protein